MGFEAPPAQYEYNALRLQLAGSHGFNPGFALFAEGGLSLGYGHEVGWPWPTPHFALDLLCGCKLLLEDGVALKLGAGLPSPLDITLLFDFGRFVTLSLFSRPCGYFSGAGLTFHHPLGKLGRETHLYVGAGGPGFFPGQGLLEPSGWPANERKPGTQNYNLQLGIGFSQ